MLHNEKAVSWNNVLAPRSTIRIANRASKLLADHRVGSRAHLLRQSEQIVLAHANLPTITPCYPQLLDIIHSRNLQTVTLNDVSA